MSYTENCAILLGAGASKADGAPLQNEVLEKFLKDYDSFSGWKEGPKDFLAFMFGVRPNSFKKENIPSFEEVLGIIDLAQKRNEQFKDFSNINIASNSGRLLSVRYNFVQLLADVLEEELSDSNNYHQKLVDNLKDDNQLRDIIFLSTNYDLLIDNPLYTDKSSFNINYGVNFTNTDDCLGNKIKLYKIHGSLNWLYCPTCNCLEYTYKDKGAANIYDEFRNRTCNTCDDIQLPHIVPPTIYKDLTDVFLNQVFQSAQQNLKNIDKLIISGYSFPEADMHIKYLLKKIEIASEKPLEIFIANDHCNKTDDERDLEESKFNRFFNKCVQYTSFSFQDFALEPQRLIP